MTRRAICYQTKAHSILCGNPATFRIWWQATGDDETTACTPHLAKAVRAYQQAHPHDTIKIRTI